VRDGKYGFSDVTRSSKVSLRLTMMYSFLKNPLAFFQSFSLSNDFVRAVQNERRVLTSIPLESRERERKEEATHIRRLHQRKSVSSYS